MKRKFLCIVWVFMYSIAYSIDTLELWKLIYDGDNKSVLKICYANEDLLNKDHKFFTACIHALNAEEKIPFSFTEVCQKLVSNNSYLGYVCLCKVNRINKNYDVATKICRNAIEINPLSDIAYLEISQIYSLKNNHTKAIEYLSNGLEISGENFFILNQMAIEYEYLGMYNKASEFYKKAATNLKKNMPESNKMSQILEKKIDEMRLLSKRKEKKKKVKKFDECIKKYRQLAKDDIEKRYKIAKECLIFSEENSEFLFEFAGLCYELNMNQDALKYYTKALPKIKDVKKKILAYERIGKIYFDERNNSLAEKYIGYAYEMGSQNLNLIKNYASLLEDSSKYQKAISVYEYLYKLKPDSIIQEKLDILKDKTLKPEEIISELKKRGISLTTKNYLLEEDKKNFSRIRAAERKGAVAYIKNKYPGYANLYVEIYDDKNFKQFLTWQGYKLYLRDVSQMAVRFFEKQGMSLNEVFKLRDIYGRVLFTQQGELTEEGWEAYFKAIELSEKTWIMSYEEPLKKVEDESVDDKKIEYANQEIKDLFSRGYVEMSESEYKWLMMATDCPKEVLENPPCDIRTVNVGKRIRYFICASDGLCSDTSLKLFSYIVRYREGDTSIPKETKATAFFGSPAGPSRKFCYKNKIWNGEE